MSEISDQLGSLASFPRELPVLEFNDLPEEPRELFAEWLDEAIKAGNRQPHAMTFVTTREDGSPVGRTLIIKDMDVRGYHFSTHRTSRKGQELAQNSRASMIFFWRESGRQVRITGRVQPLGEEASQADWRERPSYNGEPNPDWQLYALDPDEFEFLQAREDRNHTRVEYIEGADDAWSHHLVETPGG